jgi:hypothetical protein
METILAEPRLEDHLRTSGSLLLDEAIEDRLTLLKKTECLLKSHEFFRREIVRKGKAARHEWVAANAKAHCNELGQAILANLGVLGIPAREVSTELRRVAAEAARTRPEVPEIHRSDMAGQRKVRGHVARARTGLREGVGIYSRWAEYFHKLSSSGYPESRSEDGSETIQVRPSGRLEVLKRTVTDRDDAAVTVIEATYSRSDGSETWEKETTIRFKATEPERVRPMILDRPLPPRQEQCLTTWAWTDFLRNFIRINPDTMRFRIGQKEYVIDQYRFKEMANQHRVIRCIGLRNQLSEPYLVEIARKLAYLQRCDSENTFEVLVEDRLPWILGNIDYLVAYDEAEPRQARSSVAQHLREQAIAEAA